MKSFLELVEETKQGEKHHVFTYGRMNPPTTGHLKLIDKVKEVAKQHNATHSVVTSHSQDAKKNPLSGEQKVKHLQRYSPGTNFVTSSKEHPTFLNHAEKLHKQGVTHLHMVVGSDRVKEMKEKLHQYNGTHKGALYNFKKINVVSAGERDPDEEGVTGMSASKLRDYARRGDLKNFKRGIPGGLPEKEKNELFFDVRKGMGLSISLVADFEPKVDKLKTLQEFETQQVRDLYIREMIFNIGEQVNNTKLDVKGKVIRRGTNYIVLEDTNNNLHKSWIWDCIPIAADKEIMVREYNLDVDYGFKAVSEIKEEPKLTEQKKKKMFGELKKELIKMTDIKKEAYDIGHDYAQHTSKTTPGEPVYDPNYKGDKYKPSKPEDNLKKITTQDIEEWASSNETIDKYRERYGDNYQIKINEVKIKMISFKDYANK
jgi:cytidyltransferase-like protein